MSETALLTVTNGELVAGTQYQLALASLAEQAQAITEVRNQSQYTEAVELCAKAKGYTRSLIAEAEPALIEARQRVNILRDMRDKMIHAFELIADPLEKMATDWKAAERYAAQVEQEKLNKRRDGEPIKVQPNIPAVAGTRAHVNYSAELVDKDLFLRVFLRGTIAQRKYLMQFLTVDMRTVNEEARRIKSAKKLESVIPGIRGVETDRI